ncbi:MAG: anthranilate synthase component I [Halobacteriovoraceae bacterium]|nr:anthranilate synthase component I [Halobacteriovoraceae bacterium]
MLIEIERIKKSLKKENIVPVARAFSCDILTPVSAFLRLQKKFEKSFFLESVEGGERLGRYCFLGINPFEILRIKNGKFLIERDGKSIEDFSDSNPFNALKLYLKNYKSLTFPELPPFCGGAIGYIGHESIHYIEDLPFHPKNKGQSEDSAHLMLFRDIIAFDRAKNRMIIISNIFLEEESLKEGMVKAGEKIEKLYNILFSSEWVNPKQNKLKVYGKDIGRILDFNQAYESLPNEKEKDIFNKGLFGEEEFYKAVKVIKNHIRKGDIFQCVLSDRFTFNLKADPFSVYRCLRAISPAPYLFYLSLGDDEYLLGASPERLVKVENRVIQTCPIAGTRPRGKTIEQDKKFEKDLLMSVKEKAEHLMLVDLGRNDVGRVAKAGTVKVTQFMEVEKFSNVMHLVSHVEGKLPYSKSAWDALGSCFPAGTLSGAPKIKALEIIDKLEKRPRGPYGGAVIYYDFSGNLDSCINIRSLRVKNNKGFIQAGAGIVYDSRAKSEYMEIYHKSKAVREALSMAHFMEEQG